MEHTIIQREREISTVTTRIFLEMSDSLLAQSDRQLQTFYRAWDLHLLIDEDPSNYMRHNIVEIP